MFFTMGILYDVGVLFFLVALVRILKRKDLKWVVLVYFLFFLVKNLLGGYSIIPLVIYLIVKSLILYGWLVLLDFFEDTILIYILIAISGFFLFSRWGDLLLIFLVSY